MATTKKKEEMKKEEPKEALQTQTPPGALQQYDYGDDEGAGFGQHTSADYSLPFITLLQALSPQVTKRVHPMALPGNLYNTVTQEYYDGTSGILFVPSTTQHKYCRWVPRDEGGGFRGHLEPDDAVVRKAIEESKKYGKYQTEDLEDEKRKGRFLQLVETFYVYGCLCDELMPIGNALIAYTSTKISSYKQWMTRMRAMRLQVPGRTPIRPPMYANLTRVTADTDKNNRGEFFIFKMSSGDPRGMKESLLMPDDLRFLEAKACKEMVDAGIAKVDYSQQGNDERESGVTDAF